MVLKRSDLHAVKGFIGMTSKYPIDTRERYVLSIMPHMLFKGDRLYIPGRCSGFRLLNLWVGTEPVFFSGVEVPAEAFAQCRDGSLYTLMSQRLDDATVRCADFEESEDAEDTGESIGMPTCLPGMDIRLTVVNEGEPARFDAVLFGKALR